MPEGPGPSTRPRTSYRFGRFVLSTTRRQLLRDGREIPLIPRYFDLLVLLVERRHEALHRREILDGVWSDVVVSDGALSQAIRALRRTLGDESKDSVFIRTVSRHGYRFSFPDVIEEPDLPELTLVKIPDPVRTAAAGPSETPLREPTEQASRRAGDEAFESALERLLTPLSSDDEADGDGRREAAETLHALGTAEALRRLGGRPGHEFARALLRDSRWDVAGAGPVPLLGEPGGLLAARILVWMRLRRALRIAGSRWAAASSGGAVAGATAGLLGGFALRLAPGSEARLSVAAALALVGALAGGLGAAGVGAGLAAAEALVRSARSIALVVFGGLGGGILGTLAHAFARWTLEGVFGRDLSGLGGGFEGVVLGTASGLGYALSTPRPGGGMATPHGRKRLLAAANTGLACAAASIALTLAGGHLTGVSLHAIARAFQGSQVGLTPLAHLLGERELGPFTRCVIGGWEGLFFGVGLVLGLTRRPR